MYDDEMLHESDEEFKNLTSNYVNFVDDVEDIEKLI